MPLTVAWTEDEPAIAAIVRRMVERLGHRAELFATHAELLEADRAGRYAVVVLTGMDELPAGAVRAALLERAPRLAVALCSGCDAPGGLESHGAHAELFDHLLPKPPSQQDLADWLAALGAPPPGGGAVGGRGAWAGRVRRILVADDQELNRRLIQHILVGKGGVAPGAVDCSDGTDVLERRLSAPPPDLLIIDAGLPGQDAAGLVRAIRSREAEEGLAAVPIASLTADLTDESRRRLVEAGADLILARPLSAPDVLAAARALVTRVRRPLGRILVVDDQELNIRLARRILERSLPGVEVEGLTDPRAGLARCSADPRPDLLIVNGAMPGLSGPELIRELRASEAREGAAPMPVIIESSSSNYLDDALEAGADLASRLPWDWLGLLLAVRALFPSSGVDPLPRPRPSPLEARPPAAPRRLPRPVPRFPIEIRADGPPDAWGRRAGADEDGHRWVAVPTYGSTARSLRATFGFDCPAYEARHAEVWEAEAGGRRTCSHRSSVVEPA